MLGLKDEKVSKAIASTPRCVLLAREAGWSPDEAIEYVPPKSDGEGEPVRLRREPARRNRGIGRVSCPRVATAKITCLVAKTLTMKESIPQPSGHLSCQYAKFD